MTVITFLDGYRDPPPCNNPRAVLELELSRLRGMSWADPGDVDLLERITRLKDKLAALDRTSESAA